MANEGKSVPCILCGGVDSCVIRKFLVKGQSVILRRCNKDGLVYLSPRLGEKAQKEVYSRDSLGNLAYYASTFEEDVKTFMPRIEFVRRFGKPQSVLDIGSSVGTFLHCCSQKGIRKLAGIEFNRASRDYARKHFGIPTSAAMHKSGKFDLVNLSDVIEHMQNPVAELKRIRERMHKKSLLLVSTPDYNNLIARLSQVKPEEHLYYFTKKTLRQTLNKAGYNVLYLNNTSRIHTVKNLFGASTTKNAFFLISLKAISLLRLSAVFEAAIINRTNSDLLAIAQPVQWQTL